MAIMIKAQVQLPDDLYRDTKAIAKKYEMSFAEVVLEVWNTCGCIIR